MSDVVEALTKKIEAKRSQIQPLTQEIKAYKKSYVAMEEDYQTKKAEYERITNTAQSDLESTEEEYKKIKASFSKSKKNIGSCLQRRYKNYHIKISDSSH